VHYVDIEHENIFFRFATLKVICIKKFILKYVIYKCITKTIEKKYHFHIRNKYIKNKKLYEKSLGELKLDDLENILMDQAHL
jgi:hypothetical protein